MSWGYINFLICHVSETTFKAASGAYLDGLEVDSEAFVGTHRVHTQPRRVSVNRVSSLCQFGADTFCYQNSSGLPVQAQKNKWPMEWLEHWFYIKMCSADGEGSELCGDLAPLGNVSAQGVRTEVCCQVIDALRIAARYQCTRDLFEELICAKVSPLWAGQRWFAVTEDKYKDKGLKCSDIDVEAKWKNVLEKAESWKQGLRGSWPLLLNPWRSLSVGSGLMRSGASGLPFLIV